MWSAVASTAIAVMRSQLVRSLAVLDVLRGECSKLMSFAIRVRTALLHAPRFSSSASSSSSSS